MQHNDINIGDVVQMKYIAFWMMKNAPGKYTEEPAVVIERVNGNQIRVMFENGHVQRYLTEYWEVCTSNQEGVN